MKKIKGPKELMELQGSHLGWSEWEVITQERVNEFAAATGDLQWIHIDVERAKASSPFGGTIAHGYLTLSLIPHFLEQVWRVSGFRHGVNYGSDRVRFPHPVRVGSRVRGGFEVSSATEVNGGFQVTLSVTVEIEDEPKPGCVAVVTYRYFV